MAYKDKRHYVYVYLDPKKPGNYVYGDYTFDFQPFYVGKGTGGRYKQHLKTFNGDNPYKESLIKKRLSEGFEIPIKIVFYSEDAETSYIEEAKLIDLIGRICDGGVLTNYHAGGKGGTSPPEEVRQKISNSLMGRVVPEDQLTKMREYWATHPNPMKGRFGEAHPASKLKGEAHWAYGKNGKLSPTFGRVVSESQLEKMKYQSITKYYIVLDLVTDKKYEVFNVNEFCRVNNLYVDATLLTTLKGKLQSYKGLKVIEEIALSKRWFDDEASLKRYYDLIPTYYIEGLDKREAFGVTHITNMKISFTKFKYVIKHLNTNTSYIVYALTDFCKAHNLDKASLHKTYGNTGYSQHKGYVITEKFPLERGWHLATKAREEYLQELNSYKQSA